ncbi:trypsin-like serine peptidase [Nonomuraea sp. NPDC050383]|uniref:trypsin-like serine peptidase n=1 Tax=Nonomuraea sp. NPDC050383 TaxID=3364362 RepID=UPI00379EF242
MKRILLPAGGAVLATGLLAAGLTGTAQARADIATDPMARNTSQASSVASFWLASNGAALRAATAYTWDDKEVRKVVSKGGYTADGNPGSASPIGEEKKPIGRVQNVNLPKTVGKVFFVDGSGKFRWCSATSVQSNYRNLVATAGHCVYDTDSNKDVLSNWVFVPGYYQGKAPFGIYVGKQAFTHTDFDVYEDYDRDYAFVTVFNGIAFEGVKQVDRKDYERFSGPKRSWGGHYYILLSKDAGRLGDNVGGQGVAWNQATGKDVRAFGYPAGPHPDGNRPYSGVTPKWCYGKTTGKAVGASWLKIEEHVGLKCPVTPGFDGGPWLSNYSNSKRLGYVNGVTSTFADQDGNDRIDYITSPYFDGETASVYNAAKNVWSGKIVGPNGELYK